MSMTIHPIKAFTDNYIWVIHNDQHAIVVDPGESDALNQYLKSNQLTLTAIILTHHHYDHIDGVEPLIKVWDCEVYGPEDHRIKFNYQTVTQRDKLKFDCLGIEFDVIATPGHTLSHICYYNHTWLFCGDTLFNIGCGRMFEGTANQFVHSLNKIKDLNPEILVYCTHEYTLSNLKFALYIEPENEDLLAYQEKISELREHNKPSVPTSLKTQQKLNPFLRTSDPQVQKIVSQLSGQPISDENNCFAHLRKLKDTY